MSPAVPDSVDELLQRMVQFDTVNVAISGREQPERELAHWLNEVAQAWAIETRWLAWTLTESKRSEIGGDPLRAADQLLLTVRAGGGDAASASWLLFDSHLDTVAVEGMTIDPFAGRIEGDRLLGRGACDTKGTGAAMLWALKQYAASGDRPNNIALLFSTDEEFAMTGIASFIEHHIPSLGFRPAGVIVGEPTMTRPVIAHNGVVRWKVVTTGIAAHSAASYLGRSAIRMMHRVITAIEDDYIARLSADNFLTGGAVCTITTIHGGTQVNIVPDRCVIEIDRRLAPGETAEGATAALQRVLEAVRGTDADMRIALEMFRDAPPLNPQASVAFLPIVQRVLEAHGMPGTAIGAPFATHAGDLAAAGLPALVFGPGEPYPAHTKDEYVSLKDIRKGAEVYLSLMRASLGQGSGQG
jgi:acetylornithine deacetylase